MSHLSMLPVPRLAWVPLCGPEITAVIITGVLATCMVIILGIRARGWTRRLDRVLGTIAIAGGCAALALYAGVAVQLVRDADTDSRCGQNLRAIWRAMLLYQKDHGTPATTLEAFVNAERLTSDDLRRPDASLPYVYIGGLIEDPSPIGTGRIVAYEPLENHGGKGMHVLESGGRVVWLNAEAGGIVRALVERNAQ